MSLFPWRTKVLLSFQEEELKMATQLAGPLMPIRTVSCYVYKIFFAPFGKMRGWGLELRRWSGSSTVTLQMYRNKVCSSQMMTNLRNLCISLMKHLNLFSDDCFLEIKLEIAKWSCSKIGLAFLSLHFHMGWILWFGWDNCWLLKENDMRFLFFPSSDPQEGEGPSYLRGREELQGFRQPAYGPLQRSSLRHPCQESQGGCRTGRGEEEVKIVPIELCKIKCSKRSMWECRDLDLKWQMVVFTV